MAGGDEGGEGEEYCSLNCSLERSCCVVWWFYSWCSSASCLGCLAIEWRGGGSAHNPGSQSTLILDSCGQSSESHICAYKSATILLHYSFSFWQEAWCKKKPSKGLSQSWCSSSVCQKWNILTLQQLACIVNQVPWTSTVEMWTTFR